jgi:hypothetical protein
MEVSDFFGSQTVHKTSLPEPLPNVLFAFLATLRAIMRFFVPILNFYTFVALSWERMKKARVQGLKDEVT